MRTCKRCKTNEAEKGSLNCEKCNERNRKHTAKLTAESKAKNLHIPVVSNRFFKWFYTIFITGLTAILNYCFDIPQPILSGINLLLIAIAANKIADQHNRFLNGC